MCACIHIHVYLSVTLVLVEDLETLAAVKITNYLPVAASALTLWLTSWAGSGSAAPRGARQTVRRGTRVPVPPWNQPGSIFEGGGAEVELKRKGEARR